MNFKAQLGKKIHKLPLGITSFEELLFVIRSVFSDKLPEMYTFKYEDDKNLKTLECQSDFENALNYFKQEGINSIKVNIQKCQKPSLDAIIINNLENQMSQSRIISFSKHQPDEDLGQSAIFQSQSQSEIINDQQKESNDQLNLKPQQIEEINPQDHESSSQKDEILAIQQTQKINFENEQKQEQQVQDEQQQQQQIQQDEKKEEQRSEIQRGCNKIIIERDELNAMIEEIVESKIRTLLSNYDLIPKQHLKSSKNSIIDKNNYPSIVVNIADEQEKEDEEEEERKDNSQKNKNENGKSRSDSELQQSEIEKKKLRAVLKTDPPSELNVEGGSPYVWSFQIENSGNIAWPKNTFFRCLQGPHKDQKVAVNQIKPQGVVNISIPLEAPLIANKYLEIWSLVHEVPERPIQNFGPKVRYNLVVLEEENESSNRIYGQKPQVVKPSISIGDPQNESKVNSKVLDIAKKMKEILGGDLKKYIEFIQMGSHEKLPVDDLILSYIENQKF